MLDRFFLLAQSLAVAVQPDGTRLGEGSRCYTIFRGDVAIGHTWQRIRAATDGNSPVWDVVVHQRMADGAFNLRDHFILHRRDLRPIRMDSRKNGVEHVRVCYADGAIETVFAGKPPTTIPASGPLWDGNLWGLPFATLPLAPAGHYELPFYQYDKGMGRFVLDVVGSEQIAGRDAWVVEASSGDGRTVRYRIARKPAAELGYGAGGFAQRLGGDCGTLVNP